jgi:O-antigen ligase
MRSLIPLHELEGWGWFSHWRNDIVPYPSFLKFFDCSPTSGVNAYLDVWLQFGLIGQLAFLGLLVLTFSGLWLLASLERKFVYSWLPLVLVALLIRSLTESVILVEFGWLTFVVSCVKAAREPSWWRALSQLRMPAVQG